MEGWGAEGPFAGGQVGMVLFLCVKWLASFLAASRTVASSFPLLLFALRKSLERCSPVGWN